MLKVVQEAKDAQDAEDAMVVKEAKDAQDTKDAMDVKNVIIVRYLKNLISKGSQWKR